MANSIQQVKKKGRCKGSKDKNGRTMHRNSLKNLRPNPEWKPGHQGRHKGMTITQRQEQMMKESCPFDGQQRTWLEALAEGGMRQALMVPTALSNLQDRHEGKVTQPIEGSFEIKETKELTDEQLAVIAATNILRNHASRGGRRDAKEAAGS